MKKTYIFIDESGKADYSDRTLTFSISGIVIDMKNRDKLGEGLKKLKQRYFQTSKFVLHRADLRNDLKAKGKNVEAFSQDLKKLLDDVYFFVLSVLVDKSKAKNRKWPWKKEQIVKEAYRSLLSNTIKFVVAKDLCAQFITEASAYEQDISLYHNFQHFMANGIERLKISTDDVKLHVTSLSYVTKLNHDDEIQLADLVGGAAQTKYLCESGVQKTEELDSLDSVLLEIFNTRLFKGESGKVKRKNELYSAINSYTCFP